jgi:hypothetical protein
VHGSQASAWLRYATGRSPVGTLEICDEDATTPTSVALPDESDVGWADLGQACVDRLVSAFLRKDALSPPASFADGLRAQCVLDAIIDASRSERWVEVAYGTSVSR